MEELEIKLGRLKILKSLLGLCLFFALSIPLFFNSGKYISFSFRSAGFIKLIGLIGIFFTSFLFFPMLIRLFDWKFGLILNKDGIIINTSAYSLGFPILWKDITEIKEISGGRGKALVFKVKNVEYYLAKTWNPINRFALKYLGTAGSVADTLEYDYDDVKRIIFRYYKLYGESDS